MAPSGEMSPTLDPLIVVMRGGGQHDEHDGDIRVTDAHGESAS
jgi:hypothetical protein